MLPRALLSTPLLLVMLLSGPLGAQGRVPEVIRFEENEGQTDPAVRFLARGPRYTLFLTAEEAVMALAGEDGQAGVLRTRVIGANTEAVLRAERPLRGRVNHFIGSDPSRWRRNLPTFGRVRTVAILPGIDLVHHGDRGELEYDFEVGPGADPDAIELALEGARDMKLLPDGDLVLEMPAGRLVHRRPIAFQDQAGERVPVEVRFRLDPVRRRLGFDVGAYDPARLLVIDPVLRFSTYLGGSAVEQTVRTAVDADGHVLVGTQTFSADFPVSGQLLADQPNADAVVTKLTPDGSGLVWSTYLGGSANDFGPVPVHVAADGSVAVALTSSSPDMPVTGNAFMPQPNRQDAYLAVLSEDAFGVILSYGTYYGGSSFDSARGVFWGPNGLVYLAMSTPSQDMPLGQTGAAQPNLAGQADAFVAAFDPRQPNGLLTLLHASYIGGNANDQPYDLEFEDSPTSAGVVVAGTTRSTDFPVLGGFQASLNGVSDGFVTALNATLTQIGYSTYVGGSGPEDLRTPCGVDSDGAGLVYFVGTTSSTDFPVTPDALDATRDDEEAFIVVLDARNLVGGSLVYASYFGSTGRDQGHDVVTDGLGNIYLCGSAGATGFPLTLPPPQLGFGGLGDGFVAVITAPPRRVAFATPIGAERFDQVEALALDSAGNIILAGVTASFFFPTTPGAFQEQDQGANDVFVTKVDFAFAARQVYGQGHPGTNGVPALTADADPVLGSTIGVSIENSSGAATVGVLLAGTQQASISTGFGGTLLLVPQLTVVFNLPAGGVVLPFTVPTVGTGLALHLQLLQQDPGASNGVSFTPGLRLRLGA